MRVILASLAAALALPLAAVLLDATLGCTVVVEEGQPVVTEGAALTDCSAAADANGTVDETNTPVQDQCRAAATAPVPGGESTVETEAGLDGGDVPVNGGGGVNLQVQVRQDILNEDAGDPDPFDGASRSDGSATASFGYASLGLPVSRIPMRLDHVALGGPDRAEVRADVQCDGLPVSSLAVGVTREVSVAPDASGSGACTIGMLAVLESSEPGEFSAVATATVFFNSTVCRTDEDCTDDPNGGICGAGVCHDGSTGSRCSNHDDCAAPLSCSPAGSCATGDFGDPCAYDSQCSPFLVCAGTTCAEPPPCDPLDSATCPVGDKCDGGPALPRQYFCMQPGVGAPGDLCQNPIECQVGTTCIPPVCQAYCEANDDCASDEFCDFDAFEVEAFEEGTRGICTPGDGGIFGGG